MLDISLIAPWLAIAVSVGSLLYSIFNGRAQRTDERFAKIAKDHEDHNKAAAVKVGAIVAEAELLKDRVIVLENDMRHLPDKEVTHRLERAILEMRAEMRGLSEQVKPIAHMASRMQDALLEKVVSS